MESEIARLAAWWKKIFFYSIHVWYNLPKIGRGTPPRIGMLDPVQMDTQIAGWKMIFL